MDYGHIIKRSWEITWKYKLLWLFGLFATSFSFNYNTNNILPNGKINSKPPEDFTKITEDAMVWANNHLTTLAIIALIAFILTILIIVLSIICEGALIGLVEKIESGAEEVNFSTGWKIGKKCFFRILKLYLSIFLLASIIIAIPLGLTTVLFVSQGGLEKTDSGTFMSIVIALATIGLLAIFIPFSVLIGTMSGYASRFIVIKDCKSIASIKCGWNLLRANFIKSILLILINIALGIGVVIGLFVPGGIIGITGFLLFVMLGKSAILIKIIFLLFVAIFLFILILFIKALTTTFFSSYWTLAFMDLTKEPSSSVFSD
jgi:hypothetical protein